MSARWNRDTGSCGYRRQNSTDGQQQWGEAEKSQRHRIVRGFSRDMSLKAMLPTCEENFPPVLPLLLDVVRGPKRLPADNKLQEMLRAKLRILQADSAEVQALFMELSTHLLSINSEEKAVFVTFKTFEELWKFSTYYTIGFLSHCMENLLFDQKFWLSSLEENTSVEVSIQEETLSLIYRGILMHEGSLFATCSANQMFDSSTSGGDLYLEQGDIAQFEPPFLGSGWTVLCLADGARGTTPTPALEPVIPFYQWFLKFGAESILVGDGKPECDFPIPFGINHHSSQPSEERITCPSIHRCHHTWAQARAALLQASDRYSISSKWQRTATQTPASPVHVYPSHFPCLSGQAGFGESTDASHSSSAASSPVAIPPPGQRDPIPGGLGRLRLRGDVAGSQKLNPRFPPHY